MELWSFVVFFTESLTIFIYVTTATTTMLLLLLLIPDDDRNSKAEKVYKWLCKDDDDRNHKFNSNSKC